MHENEQKAFSFRGAPLMIPNQPEPGDLPAGTAGGPHPRRPLDPRYRSVPFGKSSIRKLVYFLFAILYGWYTCHSAWI